MGVKTAGRNVVRVSVFAASGRLMTSRYWPFAYTALPVASLPLSAVTFAGPLALASLTPLPFSQRSRYTASEPSPMRKYGRSVLVGGGPGGNCRDTASANTSLPSGADWLGSSHVRWKAISLSL